MAETICFPTQSFYTFIVVSLAIIGGIVYMIYQNASKMSEYVNTLTTNAEVDKTAVHEEVASQIQNYQQNIVGRMAQANMQQRQEDMYRHGHPMVPPLRRDGFGYYAPSHTTPVNVPTRGEYGPFSQLGYLYNDTDSKLTIPLMGRRIHSNRWEYYAIHHFNPNVKLPIKAKGDGELYDGDTVNLTGYSKPFKIKLYDLDQPRYIPY